MKSSQMLREAIEVIKKHGWVQSTLGTEREGFCMIGAINHACCSQKGHQCHYDYAIKALREETSLANKETHPRTRLWTGNIAWYNDTPGRTRRQVLNIMARAARKLEAEGI